MMCHFDKYANFQARVTHRHGDGWFAPGAIQNRVGGSNARCLGFTVPANLDQHINGKRSLGAGKIPDMTKGFGTTARIW